ncbi:hypothetical protein COF04_03100 [Bacillus toyonensis]|uniref:Uncharacterized protein n=1 Tax=Bacillus cereus VD196 TaxID=1053243 RepID=A0A9W5Q2Z4_BACCE|nr:MULTISPECIES: hypothetical protein [Bacillus cereus group]EOO65757.1 hypothetical protein IKE_03341 [Bacillus cereus VD196]PEF81840.1 hypothetical protein CON80_08695 [Bacillus toyonensis]PFY26447.1 hypothetical protein COL44_10335 [Bacillus toyonensis]PHC05873.1 hypothetical protein COF04_03100 [Bacillus toyonensis]PHE32903.1 hypothetical protein COF73_08140 [Bacillus toyonensis]
MTKKVEKLCTAILTKGYNAKELDSKANALLDKLFHLRTIEKETAISIKETKVAIQAVMLAKKQQAQMKGENNNVV